MFKNLSSLFGGKKAAEPKPTPAPETQYREEPRAEAPVSRETSAPQAAEPPKAAPAPAKRKVRRLVTPSAPTIDPETLCGITAEMTHEEVYARLASLYRRYNRATSSLNASLRSEAEQMLTAIVAVRERIWGAV